VHQIHYTTQHNTTKERFAFLCVQIFRAKIYFFICNLVWAHESSKP